jgi:AraC family transcriptional regulator
VNAIQRAVWHIETQLAEPFSLENMARAAGVSKFHLSRSFGFVTGMSPSAFARARRLTEAARRLAEGEGDILSLALDTGYGSHEAFTRAFRDQFGFTPEQVRAARSTANLNLVEARTVNDFPAIKLAEPEIAQRGPTLVAGLSQNFLFSERGAIPTLWQKFMPLMLQVPDLRPGTTYGIIMGSLLGDDGFDYTAAIEIRSIDEMPVGLKALRIPAGRSAIFRHGGHVADVGAVCNAIATDWSDRTDLVPSEGPIQMIEHYPPSFDPMTGQGGFEIWLPLAQ